MFNIPVYIVKLFDLLIVNIIYLCILKYTVDGALIADGVKYGQKTILQNTLFQ